ncbi:hypothetical protein SDC9_208330 [bioreactor metagenome]|uniref:Uncharacterized protein n=1 Tax=bioreactor metagenome TaxID=1076179 RepID=A0A645JAG5_9ZZZZ
MFGQQGTQRDFHLLFRRGYFGEDRGFMQRNANVQTDNHQYRREDERYAPTPAHELLVGQQPGEQQKGTIGEEEADRRAQLRK